METSPILKDSDALPAFDQAIDDVGLSTWTYFKANYLIWGIAIALIVIITDAVVIIYYPNAYQVLIFDLILPLFFYRYVSAQVEHAFMKQFATANGYAYSINGSFDTKTGYIFALGRSRQLSDSITGTYQNCPINLFNYEYTIGDGKNSHTYKLTIFEIDFQTPVPHIVLKKHFMLDMASSGTERITLEGDFDKHFDLFVAKGYSLEALQIFSPDFMSQLETEDTNYDLEFVDTKLYIYAGHMIGKRTELEDIYKITKDLASRLDPILDKMKSDITAMAELTKLK